MVSVFCSSNVHTLILGLEGVPAPVTPTAINAASNRWRMVLHPKFALRDFSSQAEGPGQRISRQRLERAADDGAEKRCNEFYHFTPVVLLPAAPKILPPDRPATQPACAVGHIGVCWRGGRGNAMDGMVRDGRGDKAIADLKFRCSVCGTVGSKTVQAVDVV